MKFEELQEFLILKMRMEKGHNYQPVMIKKLLKGGGAATKKEIIQALQKENPQYDKKRISQSPVFTVLTLNHPVATFDKTTKKYFMADYDSLSNNERHHLILLCEQKISEAGESVRNSGRKPSKATHRRTCRGACKRFRVLKQSGVGRYASGQGRCQICDVWIDHNECHLKDGSPATKHSVGWFCNCCNFRVRQKPRKAEYKEKLRNKTVKHNVKRERYDNDPDTFSAAGANIGEHQADLLKLVAPFMDKIDKLKDPVMIFDFMPEYLTKEIKDKWGLEEFISLAMNRTHPNKISLIIMLEQLKKDLGRVPTKTQFLAAMSIDEDLVNTEFQSWNGLLDLLRYALPHEEGFKDAGSDRTSAGNSKSFPAKNRPEITLKSEYSDHDTPAEMSQKVDLLRGQIQEDCKRRDARGTDVGYSYGEMFRLLEIYLMMLPSSSRYSSVDDFV